MLWSLLAVTLVGCSQGPPAGPAAGPGGVMLGMTRQEVIQVMLDDVQQLQMSGMVTNPFKTRFFRNVDGATLEVMYYYTGMKRGDDRVTREEVTPVILKDDAVVGWGWEALQEMTGKRQGLP